MRNHWMDLLYQYYKSHDHDIIQYGCQIHHGDARLMNNCHDYAICRIHTYKDTFKLPIKSPINTFKTNLPYINIHIRLPLWNPIWLPNPVWLTKILGVLQFLKLSDILKYHLFGIDGPVEDSLIIQCSQFISTLYPPSLAPTVFENNLCHPSTPIITQAEYTA
jgi:hypothetical protein